jgi:hypothetical protein
MTEGMMGRGSDTRIYAPRSESSHMFRANHEDEETPTGLEDARDKEARMDRKQKKQEREEKEDRQIRHIKVRRHHMGLGDKPEEGMEEEESLFKPRESPTEPTQPAGAGGFLTSLAAQAKGPGAAGGEMIQMSEPMVYAWSELLKNEQGPPPKRDDESMDEYMQRISGPFGALPVPYRELSVGPYIQVPKQQEFDPQFQQKNASEPMVYAWSELLKSKRKQEKRRKTEERAKWRPSTGKFNRPRGGYTGRSGTSARAKLLSRNLPMGRKTGLMQPHLSVEMSHRGIASKQPMSKDPQAYGQWRGYQEQQSIRGQIAPQSGAALPFGQVRMPSAPRPRLHPVRAPPIQPPKMRMPHLNRPSMPGMVTMSEDPVPEGDLLKAGTNHYLLAEARTALREMRQLMRRMKDKDDKKKNMGAPDTAGAASTLPKYPGNNPKQTTRGEGGTEDENDPRTWGLDPIGQLVGRGGNRA